MKTRSHRPLAVLLASVTVLAGCLRQGAPETQSPPEVTVQRPQREPVTDCLELTGTVAASRTVNLVARVTGYLESVHFEDGTYVDEGDLLFIIEPKPYEEQLALSQAQLDQARAEYDRQRSLLEQNATSVASTEKWRSQRDQAAAQVELARLNLSYTRVTAPFSGRIGRRLVDPGNLVGAGGATELATLDQLLPIHVYFNLNERDALRLRDEMAHQGWLPFSQVGKAPVQVGLQNETGVPHEGVLDFADSSVSTATGTIQLRGVFKNEDRALFPGLFARVRIPLGEPSPALVIPDTAIGNDPQGDYVLVVGTNHVVQRKAVEPGMLTPGGRAIRNGLSAEDQVIVMGLQQARPGETVTVIPSDSASAAR